MKPPFKLLFSLVLFVNMFSLRIYAQSKPGSPNNPLIYEIPPIKSYNHHGKKDILYLKNGSVIQGIILEIIPGNTLKIKTTDNNIFTFKIVDIEKILKGTANERYQEKEDVIYLKNDSVLHGKIQEINPADSLKILLANKEVLLIKMDDLEKIIKSTINYDPNKDNKMIINFDLGYSWGIGNMTSSFNEQDYTRKNNQYGLTLRISSDYKIAENYLLGLGIGFERYFEHHPNESTAYIPVFLDTRFLFTSGSRFVPGFNLDAGYDIGITRSGSTLAKYAGGFFVNPSVNFFIKSSANTSLNLNFGYEYQNHSVEASALQHPIILSGNYITARVGLKF